MGLELTTPDQHGTLIQPGFFLLRNAIPVRSHATSKHLMTLILNGISGNFAPKKVYHSMRLCQKF